MTKSRIQLLDEDDAKSQLETILGECASLATSTSRPRPALTGDVLADLDAMRVWHACRRVDARVASRTSGQHEGNRSRPGPVRQPKPDDSPKPGPQIPPLPSGRALTVTERCLLANGLPLDYKWSK